MMQKCGLLGRKLGHSYSPQIHRLLADYEYKLYEKEPEELESFLKEGDWTGLNVTVPYKKDVIPNCNELSDLAKRIGSVNTLVKRPDGTIYGDNTDAFGFSCMLQRSGMNPEGKTALVLGNGGACASVRTILADAGAQVVVISRRGEDNYTNLDRHRDAALIVNTTPVGMYPNNGERPLDLSEFPCLEAVLDIVYNPARTGLLLQAEELGIPNGNGLYMLVAQAKRSSEQFCRKPIADEKIEAIERQLAGEMQNLILVGMPGSGKSAAARTLGRLTGREVLELDAEFTKKYNISPAECIKTQGESAFRKMETEVIREAGKSSGKIISTGGGCVTIPENYPLLHQNGTIVWIKREVESLAVEGRPLSQSGSLASMYEVRKPLYERFADITVENNGTVEELAERILAEIK